MSWCGGPRRRGWSGLWQSRLRFLFKVRKKQFFFEKKNQKTFAFWGERRI
jgi:hypothetical protein